MGSNGLIFTIYTTLYSDHNTQSRYTVDDKKQKIDFHVNLMYEISNPLSLE